MGDAKVHFPRVIIQFCTQCKWNLRAAYSDLATGYSRQTKFAQELLSTFSTAIGEVTLVPATGGVFVIEIQYRIADESAVDRVGEVEVKTLWNRTIDGGFPETKELKKRVRDCIQLGRDLGHVDGKKSVTAVGQERQGLKEEDKREEKVSDAGGRGADAKEIRLNAGETKCEDCA